MLRGSRLNPKVSALTQLNGHFDFNQTPIAPPGIPVLAHNKSANQTTWSPHAEDGWYTGPVINFYQCYCIWVWGSGQRDLLPYTRFGEQQGTNSMFFIPHISIPKDKKPTYLQVVSANRPEKAHPCCICWTVGGDHIFYAADVSTKAADQTTAKILLNSVISTPGARFLGIDIKDFHLGTVMTQYEYMCIPL
jgi:hypothetical protein